jgi:DNA repair exonuclease SbcCD nuclease subunit
MSTRFLHTADWQLGKPFARVSDPEKRIALQRERIAVIERIGLVAGESKAEFIVVAGDLFDSPTPSRNTVAAACGAIGKLALPVFVIPGNHDYAGPGTLWEQPFFVGERESLAPNLHVLLKREPVETDRAWLFPCPLLRRAEAEDPTAWLRALPEGGWESSSKPRIVLAHGAAQEFGSSAEEDEESGATNLLELGRLPEGVFDYVALGDWHGTYRVSSRALFSGTPELDRFPKGGEYKPGQVLLVNVARGQMPVAQEIVTRRFGWHELRFDWCGDAGLSGLRDLLDKALGARVGEDLLRLTLTGALGVSARTELRALLDSLEARLLRLDLDDRLSIAPTPAEVEQLAHRPDPVTARVASQLLAMASGPGDQAAVAQAALCELFSACQTG